MIISLLFCAVAFSFVHLPATEAPKSPVYRHPLPRTEKGDVGYQSNNSNPLAPLIILVSLTIYTASYASGLGNVPWQQSELFPLDTRALGSAISTATNWGANTVVGLSFLPMMEWMSPVWTFVVYALVCLIGWLTVWIIYPEMSGLGLEEVRGLLADGFGVKESLERRKRRKL
jgi:SP family myo-inositol transporter-like MFS transporter 13